MTFDASPTARERIAVGLTYVLSLLILGFLVLPIVAIVPLSFTHDSILSYPIERLSLRWYRGAHRQSRLGDGARKLADHRGGLHFAGDVSGHACLHRTIRQALPGVRRSDGLPAHPDDRAGRHYRCRLVFLLRRAWADQLPRRYDSGARHSRNTLRRHHRRRDAARLRSQSASGRP